MASVTGGSRRFRRREVIAAGLLQARIAILRRKLDQATILVRR